MLCRKCGKENEEKAKYFSFCGAKLLKEESINVSRYLKKYDNRLKEKRTIQIGILIAVILAVVGAVCTAAIIQLNKSDFYGSDKKIVEENSSEQQVDTMIEEVDVEA